MGIRIKKITTIINTFDYEPVYPANYCSKDDIIEYEKKNSFPITDEYTREMMITDMQHSYEAGLLTFSGLSDEQLDWIETFLNEMI